MACFLTLWQSVFHLIHLVEKRLFKFIFLLIHVLDTHLFINPNPIRPMNQRLRTSYFIAFLCLLGCGSSNLFAQISLKIPAISNASVGQILKLPVTVNNFDSVVAAQFVLRWDPTVLQFQSVDKFNLPDFSPDKIGSTNALDSGFIRVVWTYYTSAGTTLPDGAAICFINLKVIGPINSGTSILFTELPPLTYFEFTKANGAILNTKNVEVFNGFVAIGYSITDVNSPTENLQLDVFPNPFSEKINVNFTMPTADFATVRLVDISGKILFEKKDYFQSGTNGIVIDFHAIPPRSQYFLIVSTQLVKHAIPMMNYER